MIGYIDLQMEAADGRLFYIFVKVEKIPDKKVRDFVFKDLYDLCEKWGLFDIMVKREYSDVLGLVKLLKNKPSPYKYLADLEEVFWVGAATKYVLKYDPPVKFKVVSIEKLIPSTPDRIKLLKETVEVSRNLDDLDDKLGDIPWIKKVNDIAPYVSYGEAFNYLAREIYNTILTRGVYILFL
jgi:hypothetical protein